MSINRLTLIVGFLTFICNLLGSIEATNLTEENDHMGNTRLVGAVEADIHSAPFLAAILVKSRTKGLVQFCAGAIIRTNYVLTAAHCLKLEPHRLHLIAGLHNVKNLEYWATQKRRCEQYVKHPKFTTLGPYDIGIIRTNAPFTLNKFVKAIPLSRNDDPIGNVLIYGWGSTDESTRRNFPNKLRVASLTLVTYKYCQGSFPTQKVQRDTNLCAGLPDYLSSACVGDSGGPAIQNGYLIGLVSWGPSNCKSESGPTILTRIEYYYPWVIQNLRLLSLNYDSKPEHPNDVDDNSMIDAVDDNVIDDLLNEGVRPGTGYVILDDE